MEAMDVHNLIPFTRQTAGETTAHFITRRDRDLAEVKKNMQHFGFTTVLEYIKHLQSEVEKVNTRIANTQHVPSFKQPKFKNTKWRNTEEESRNLRANNFLWPTPVSFSNITHNTNHFIPHIHIGEVDIEDQGKIKEEKQNAKQNAKLKKEAKEKRVET